MNRTIHRLLATAFVLELLGCADAADDDESPVTFGDASAESSADDPEGEADEVCYFEYRASYSCSDGDGDPGVWEATCSAIAEDACGGGDFNGSSDYIDGCVFLTEFRSVQWLDADACEDMLPDASEEPSEPAPSDDDSFEPDPYGSCADGYCEDPNAAYCMSTPDGAHNVCARECWTIGSPTECPSSDSGTGSVCAANADGGTMCVLDCTYGGCPSGMSCTDVSGDGSFAICLW